ncbi:Amidophosphoribosyltransferase 2, chloroplastic [Linum perenne]
MQHRGQEGTGIVTVKDQVFQTITGVGLVTDVFNESKINQLPGDLAIGHVRYSTAGSSMLKNVQPFIAGYRFGSDIEAVLHLIAISKARPFLSRMVDACEKLEGAYSMVFITEDKLVAVRDPHGYIPLVMGRENCNGAIVFASETCALDLIDVGWSRAAVGWRWRSGAWVEAGGASWLESKKRKGLGGFVRD